MFPRKLFWRTLTFFEFLYPTRTTFGPFLIKSNLFHNSLTVRTEISPHTCFWYQMIEECIRFRKSTWVKGFDSRNFCHGKFFYPYPTKNDKNYNNYVLKFHFRPQIIKIPYIMTAIVSNVVRRTILSSFGNRKSVLIVKKYKNEYFQGFSIFLKIDVLMIISSIYCFRWYEMLFPVVEGCLGCNLVIGNLVFPQ